MSKQDTSSNATATPTLALVAIIALVIAGLAALDRFLANAQDVEVQRLAQRSYANGIRFRHRGNISEAIEGFRKAHALERRNTEYELTLVDTLIAADKLDQAERLIRDVLEREPNDGRANLLGAHLMIKRGKTVEAESYYHRAIYGEWSSDAVTHRVAVRMELVEFLAARPEHDELLAELLPLQEQAGKDPETEKHLAHLFLVAGSPSRAADQYRAVIKETPKDAAAHVGLGEAELQRGDYGRARAAFLTASAYKPDDPAIRRQLQLASTLAALDTTSRKLTSIEKYRRSLRILELARSSLERCLANRSDRDPDERRQLLGSVNDILTSKRRTDVTNETSENALGLAEKAWQARIKACGVATSPDEEPLRLMMERLAQ
jgi:tetratricopeptide (TPR) repeat protein